MVTVSMALVYVYDEVDLTVNEPYMKVIGNVHPLWLHLPIGGLVFLVILDLGTRLRWVQTDVRLLSFMLVCTSSFAHLSFFSGYVLSKQGGYPADLLNKHLWSASVYVAFVVLCSVIKAQPKSSGPWRVGYDVCLFCSLMFMGLTGHYGGLMTHGDPLAPLYPAETSQVSALKPIEQRLIFQDVVQPILADKCYDCHGNGKSKGKLRLDTYESIVKGGRSAGATLIAGHADTSLLITSLLLPMDDEEHMPPAKQEQLTDDEIRVLEWWVQSGAVQDLTVAELDVPPDILTALTNLVPKDVREQIELTRLNALAKTKADAKQQRMDLNEMMQESIPKPLHPLVRYVSPYSANIHLSSVSMQGEFGDVDYKALHLLAPHLVSVDLSYSSITASTIQLLSNCENIHSLRLGGTSLESSDIANLSGLKQLNTLSLHSTKVGSSVLPHLAKMSSLRTLYLWSTKINPDEIASFQEANPSVSVVY